MAREQREDRNPQMVLRHDLGDGPHGREAGDPVRHSPEQDKHEHAVDRREHTVVHQEERHHEELRQREPLRAALDPQHAEEIEESHDDVLEPEQKDDDEHVPPEE